MKKETSWSRFNCTEVKPILQDTQDDNAWEEDSYSFPSTPFVDDLSSELDSEFEAQRRSTFHAETHAEEKYQDLGIKSECDQYFNFPDPLDLKGMSKGWTFPQDTSSNSVSDTMTTSSHVSYSSDRHDYSTNSLCRENTFVEKHEFLNSKTSREDPEPTYSYQEFNAVMNSSLHEESHVNTLVSRDPFFNTRKRRLDPEKLVPNKKRRKSVVAELEKRSKRTAAAKKKSRPMKKKPVNKKKKTKKKWRSKESERQEREETWRLWCSDPRQYLQELKNLDISTTEGREAPLQALKGNYLTAWQVFFRENETVNVNATLRSKQCYVMHVVQSSKPFSVKKKFLEALFKNERGKVNLTLKYDIGGGEMRTALQLKTLSHRERAFLRMMFLLRIAA